MRVILLLSALLLAALTPLVHATRPNPVHRSSLENATCPNGQMEEAEQCDDNNGTNGDGCASNCRLIQCGDGAREPIEDCDDGSINNVNDGCGGEFCEVTPGWLCGPLNVGDPASISVCTPNCGDGQVIGSEQCDGANLNGQTCSTQGFVGGDLSCTAQCQFNTSLCTNSQPPVAFDDVASTNEDTTATISFATLLANDTDPENNPLTITATSNAINGSAQISGNDILFTPTAQFSGSAQFEYTVSDGNGGTDTATVVVSVSAIPDAPVLFVQRAVLALAHGTGGTAVDLPIMTWLGADRDGSEVLTVRISGVPTGLSFNAGTNQGGGVWQFNIADLPGLQLNLPGSYTTNATNMTVQAIATEQSNSATSSSSNVTTLKAAYTTVDITTSESGSYTGSSANEFIQGGGGNNTINGNAGNNLIRGEAGDDNLSSTTGSDVIFGGTGVDNINSGSGTDVIIGGAGSDTLAGGAFGEGFVDVFTWQLGDQSAPGSPPIDVINNFTTTAAGSNTNGGDVFNLRHLLQGEQAGSATGVVGNLADYLHFEISGGDTLIHISHTGGYAGDAHVIGGAFTSSATTQIIQLVAVNLPSLYANASTDQAVIEALMQNSKLVVH